MTAITPKTESSEPSRCLRAEPRFSIRTSCRFWWPTQTGDCTLGLGRTTDLGMRGVSVTSAVLPPLGSRLMLEIDLQHFADLEDLDLPCKEGRMERESRLLLTADGVVLRHRAEGDGFAARIAQASFAHSGQETFA